MRDMIEIGYFVAMCVVFGTIEWYIDTVFEAKSKVFWAFLNFSTFLLCVGAGMLVIINNIPK